jgi:hypothetical protein
MFIMRSGAKALAAILLIVLGPATALAAATTIHLSMPSHVDPAQLSITSITAMYTTDDSGAPITGDTLLSGGPVGGLDLLDRITSSGSYVPITAYYFYVPVADVQADTTVGSGFSSFTPWTATTEPDGTGGTLVMFQETLGSAPLEGGLYMADVTADSTDPAFLDAQIVATGTPVPEFPNGAPLPALIVAALAASRMRKVRRTSQRNPGS